MSTRPVIDRMPDFFPTYVPECKEDAFAFFRCFEAAAVMKHERDVESAPNALLACQDTLYTYKTCMDKNNKREGKKWWQLK